MATSKDTSPSWDRGYMAALQDFCENCHFASAGGKELRANKGEHFKAPNYIPVEDVEAYLDGYRAHCQEVWGDDWDTCEFGWKPVMTIENEKREKEDDSVSLRFVISQGGKELRAEKAVTQLILNMFNMSELTMLQDMGQQLVRQTIDEWLKRKADGEL